MRTSCLSPLVAVLAGVVVMGVAPSAEASTGETRCDKRGAARVCQKPGHAFLHSEPPAVGGMPSAVGLFDPRWLPGYGRTTGVTATR